jgi:hypothetical protein
MGLASRHDLETLMHQKRFLLNGLPR